MKTKIAIGCLVQWYEIEIIEEYLDTLKDAVDFYEGPVLLDFIIISNEDLEKCLNSNLKNELVSNIENKINTYFKNYNLTLNIKEELHTIADYRREFNQTYCTQAGVLVWGEADMLVPQNMFTVIDLIHTQVQSNTPKYILTFGINKMWDDSWKPLEHPKFTVKNHSDNPEDWWGVRHVTTKEEMNNINKDVTDLDISIISPFKFNGCGLVISSELVKAGANIPKSVFFVHEDTAFLLILKKLYSEIPQYHIRNIYLPHNRKHLYKRAFIKGEENMDKNDIGKLRKSHDWYVKGNKFSEENCYNLFNPKHIAKTWEDVFDENP